MRVELGPVLIDQAREVGLIGRGGQDCSTTINR